mmetsp:Transcript_10387/g.17438  ORF Transcript_10387/g.17438 Transcript_10387/m.17438 type:complete len:163 (-) Transcript_10387:14-502(-)
MDQEHSESDPFTNESPRLNFNLMPKKEQAIREQEYKKVKLTEFVQKNIGDNIKQIVSHQWIDRLLQCPPAGYDIAKLKDILVIQDDAEEFPSFTRAMYCNIDYSLLILYIMYFIFFVEAFKFNSLLSLFLVYVIERVLRHIRSTIGENTLSQKSYIDKNFFN